MVLPDLFFETIYEKTYSYWRLAQADRPPFGDKDADLLLFRILHRPEGVNILKEGAGQTAKAIARTDGYVSPKGIETALSEGFSVRIVDICRLSPGLYDWAIKQFGSVLTSAIQANLYVSPPGPPALKPHQDGHDVFIYQVFGEKEWHFSPPTGEDHVVLPLETQARADVPFGENRTVLTLSPGDLLYLPRGYVHAATWKRDISVHITFGVHPVRWNDLIAEMVTQLAEKDDVFRTSVRRILGNEQKLRQEALLRFFATDDLVRQSFGEALTKQRAKYEAIRQSWDSSGLTALSEKLAAKEEPAVATATGQ